MLTIRLCGSISLAIPGPHAFECQQQRFALRAKRCTPRWGSVEFLLMAVHRMPLMSGVVVVQSTPRDRGQSHQFFFTKTEVGFSEHELSRGKFGDTFRLTGLAEDHESTLRCFWHFPRFFIYSCCTHCHLCRVGGLFVTPSTGRRRWIDLLRLNHTSSGEE